MATVPNNNSDGENALGGDNQYELSNYEQLLNKNKAKYGTIWRSNIIFVPIENPAAVQLNVIQRQNNNPGSRIDILSSHIS